MKAIVAVKSVSAQGAAVLAVVLSCGVAPAFSQWVRYPTADVPRRPDGKPDLSAPPPRLADGKPDFSGIWGTAVKAPCVDSRTRPVDCGIELPMSPLGVNIGLGVAGGLPYQPWAAALVKQRIADGNKDDPHAHCLPDNPPRPYGLPHLMKIVHTPRLLIMLFEFNVMYRQIFIDGRPLPSDPNPSWNGYSSARWDGETLVVRTNGFRPDSWVDVSGSPMTDAGMMTERIRRPTFGSLEVEITIDDPKAYTRPWTVSMNQEIKLDVELIDDFCIENEKASQRMRGDR
jgi:hypothetical protein